MTTDPNRPIASVPYATPVARRRTPAWVWLLVGGGVVVVLVGFFVVAGAVLFYARLSAQSGPATVVAPAPPVTDPAATAPATGQ